MSINIKDYDFNLPPELIAKEPIYPRDEARLLVYNRKDDKIIHTKFKHILDFIPKDICFFFNNTKVIKARLLGNKSSGGQVELLVNSPLDNNQFMVYIKGKVHIGNKIIFQDSPHNLEAEVIKINQDGSRIVIFTQNGNIIDFDKLINILDKIAKVPIPPYLKRDSNSQDELDYQSIFASLNGSVAAPTASLHFTKELYEKISTSYETRYITLHIGAGTFKPVEVDDIHKHKMHLEYYNIEQSSIDIINSNKKILAIGTTATRAIESYVRTNEKQNNTKLFLHLENKPQRVDYLITNFHFPKSTLLMLVSSFIGLDKTLQIYKEAMEQKYRFYSYGDCMLIA